MKYFFLGFLVVCLLVAVVAGPRGIHSPNRPLEFFPDMVRQSKVKAQSPNKFFANGVSSQRPVEGTVPLGYAAPRDGEQTTFSQVANTAAAKPLAEIDRLSFSHGPDYYSTGMIGDQWGTGIPIPVTPELLARGQQRFQINCQVCHGGAGGGNGVTSKYGLANIANYHDPKYLKMADGEIYYTITNGHNSMNGYGANLAVKDRWAIVCYIRALQRSQNVRPEELAPGQRAALDTPPAPAAAPAPAGSPAAAKSS